MTPIETYIRQAAAARGIDPDVAVRVAMSEGGVNDPVRQSDIVKNGIREPSFGSFQMNMTPGALGDQALKAGIDVRDPNQWQKGVDFALDYAKGHGWGSWFGAKNTGIQDWQGISGPAAGPTPGTSYTTQPGVLETTGRKGEEVWAQPETHVRHPQNPQVGIGGYVAPGAPTTMPPGTIAPVTSIADAAALDKMNPWSSIGSGLASSVSNDTGLSSPDTAQLAAPETDFVSAIPPQAAAPDLPPGGEIGQLADLFKVGDFGQAAALNVDRMGQPIRRRQYG